MRDLVNMDISDSESDDDSYDNPPPDNTTSDADEPANMDQNNQVLIN